MRSKLFVTLSAILMISFGAARESSAYGTTVRGPAVVNCGAYARPVVHRVWVRGRLAERVSCVRVARYNNYGGRYYNGRYYGARRTVVPHRSWKKSALVIGGSTAAGAGAGALVGGSKGALIGGAVGGAAGTAYEVHKRHTLRHRHRHYRR